MSAMKVVDLNQGSDEWLVWRSKGITASDMPVILGLSPYKTPWQLWAEKIGRINAPDLSNNPNVQRGHRLEDEARLVAEERYDEILLPLCGECAQWDTFRASFDGLDSIMIPHEFKAPSQKIWDEIKKNGTCSDTYKLYESQVHAQCVVAGVYRGRLMFYLEDGQDMEFEVILTPEREAEILQAAKTFWEHVDTNTAPVADPEKDWFIPVSGEQKFKWDAYADAWRAQNQRIKALKDKLKALSDEQKEYQESLVTIMGPFMQADVGGVKVTRYTKKGSVDYGKFLKDKLLNEDVSSELEVYRKASRDEVRFSMSEDELVNPNANEVVSTVKASFF
jgi:putative phage-type endonuclease